MVCLFRTAHPSKHCILFNVLHIIVQGGSSAVPHHYQKMDINMWIGFFLMLEDRNDRYALEMYQHAIFRLTTYDTTCKLPENLRSFLTILILMYKNEAVGKQDGIKLNTDEVSHWWKDLPEFFLSKIGWYIKKFYNLLFWNMHSLHFLSVVSFINFSP